MKKVARLLIGNRVSITPGEELLCFYICLDARVEVATTRKGQVSAVGWRGTGGGGGGGEEQGATVFASGLTRILPCLVLLFWSPTGGFNHPRGPNKVGPP